MENEKNNKRVYNVNDDYFDVINPEQAWLLGILASDGCISKDRFLVIGQSGDQGLILIKKIINLLDFEGNIYTIETGFQPFYRIQINSFKICQRLADFNIVSNKSLIYTFPKKLPVNMIPYFVAGYIDGDGSIGVYKANRYVKTLVLSVVGTEKFIIELNQVLPIKSVPIRKLKAKNCFELRWHGTNAVELGEWIWGNDPIYPSNKFKIMRAWADLEGNEILKIRNKRLELKTKVLAEVKAGESVLIVAKNNGIAFGTIYKWLRKEKNNASNSKISSSKQ